MTAGRSLLNFSKSTYEPNAPIPDGCIALGRAGPYSNPNANPEFLLPLPAVRVHVPALKDATGFCKFKLIYKIVDRENPELTAPGQAHCVSIDQLVPN